MGKPCRSPSRLGAHMVVSSDLLSRVGQRTWCEVCSIVPWCVWLSCASHITFGPLGLCYPPFSSRWEIGLGCWGFPPSCHWQQIQNHKATAGPSKCHQSDVLVGRAEPEPEHDPICDRETRRDYSNRHNSGGLVGREWIDGFATPDYRQLTQDAS